MKKLFILLTTIIIFNACSSTRVRLVPQGGKPPAKLAVVIPNNETNDLLGGYVLRNLFHKELVRIGGKGYIIQPRKKTDKLLNEAGLTDGGQIDHVFTPLEVCQILGVDGLVYIDIEEIGIKILPFYHSRYIVANYRLYNFNRLVWQKPVNITNRVVEIKKAINTISDISNGDYDKAAQKVGTSVGVQIAAKVIIATAFDHELKPELILNMQQAVSSIPYGSKFDKLYLKLVKKRLEKLDQMVKDGVNLEEAFVGPTTEKEEVVTEENGINVITH